MHNNNVLLMFIVCLASLSVQTCAQNWILWKGYGSVENISVLNWNGVFEFKNTGTQGYAYATLTNDISNNYVIFSGYNSTGSFVGNITGWAWDNGFILANKTSWGYPYSTITAYYNPIAAISQYAYSAYFSTDAKILSTICGDPYQTLTIYGNLWYPVLGNSEPHYPFSILFDDDFIPFGYEASACPPLINITSSYLLFSNNLNTNLSLKYTPTSRNYLFVINSTRTNLTTLGYLTKSFVTAPPIVGSCSSCYSVYINPYVASRYPLLSSTLGIDVLNNYIFNSSTTKTQQIGGSLLGSTAYALTLYGNVLNAGLIPNINYYLMPSYTTNIITTYNTVSNVQLPPANISSTSCTTSSYNESIGWLCNYQQRVQITNITWKYYFNTMSYPSKQGSTYAFPINTSYTLLSIPHYSTLSCSSIDVEAGIMSGGQFNDYGSVPFYIYNCGSDYVQLLITNKTIPYAYKFNSLFVFYNSPTKYGVAENYSVLNKAQPYTNQSSISYMPYVTNTSTASNVPMILTLSGPLNLYSNVLISRSYQDGSGNQFWNTFIFGEHQKSGVLNDYMYDYFKQVYNNNYIIIETSNEVNSTYLYNTKILFYANATNLFLVSNTLSMNAILSGTYSKKMTMYNTTNTYTSLISPYPFVFTGNGITANMSVPFSTIYTLRQSETRPSYSNTGAPTGISNYSTPTGNLTNIFSQNALASKLSGTGLNVMVNWNNFSIPLYALFLLVLIITIIMMAINNEAGIIISVICMWITGILSMPTTSIFSPTLIIAAIVTLVYIVYNLIER